MALCPPAKRTASTEGAPHVNKVAATEVCNCEYGCTMAYMVHRLLDFREAELTAVADMHGVPASDLNLRTLPGDSTISPFRLVANVSTQQCNQICSRAVLTKVHIPMESSMVVDVCAVHLTQEMLVCEQGLFELWGIGTTMDELKQSVRKCPEQLKTKWFGENVSFRYVIEGFGVSVPEVPDKSDMMDSITEVCPFQVPHSCLAAKNGACARYHRLGHGRHVSCRT